MNEMNLAARQKIARKIGVGLGMLILALMVAGSMLAATSDEPLGNTTSYAKNVSLALDDNDIPIFSFWTFSPYISQYFTLQLFACNDQGCDHQLGGAEQASFLAPNNGIGGSMVLDSADNPVYSYTKVPENDLMLLHCDDHKCDQASQGGESLHPIDSAANVGTYSSVAIDAAGNPVIAYFDAELGHLKLAHCNDPNCNPAVNGAESIQTIFTYEAEEYLSLALDANGFPVIGFYDTAGNGHVNVAHCNDPNCNPAVNGAESIEMLATVWLPQSTITVKINQFNHPVVAYYHGTASALQVVVCNDPNCGGVNGSETPITIDAAGEVGEYASMIIGQDGNPIFSYYDRTNGDLKLAWCSNPLCTGSIRYEVAASEGDVGRNTALAQDSSGNLVVVYGEGEYSMLRLLRWFPEQPIAPSNLRVGSDLTLHWTDNSSDEASFQIQYVSAPGAGGSTNWTYSKFINVAANTTSASLSEIDCGVQLSLRVRAIRTGDEAPSKWSDTISVGAVPCTLTAPSNFAASSGASSITMTWGDTTTAETGFEIQRSENYIFWGASRYVPVAVVSSNTTSYADNIPCGTGHIYRIRAIGPSGAKSAWVGTHAAYACPMPPPTNFSAAPAGLGQINLTWTDNSNNESAYRVERQNGSNWLLLANVVGSAYSDTTASCGVSYTYRISAFHVYWYTVPQYVTTSGTASACPAPPHAPTGLGASVAGNGAVTLTWADNSTDETGFSVRRLIPGSEWTDLTMTAANVTSYTTQPACLDSYYLVKAYRKAGNQYSSEAMLFVDLPACTPTLAPSNLVATAPVPHYVELTWQNNTAGAPVAYQRSMDGINWPQGGSGSPYESMNRDHSVTCGNTYYYRVYAYHNERGQSGYSNVASIYVPCASAPTNVRLESSAPEQVELYWTLNSGPHSITQIERSPNGSTGWILAGMTGEDRTHHSDAGLVCGSTYYYRIRVYYSNEYYSPGGHSAYSIPTSFTVPCAAAPAAPSNLSATGVSQTQIDLSWTDNSNDEYYFDIERSTDGGTDWTAFASTGANAQQTTFSHTGLNCGVSYFYRVRAYRSVDLRFSIYSNTAKGITLPCGGVVAAPTNLVATAQSSTQIDLSWTNNASNQTSFKIERSPNGATNWTQIGTTEPIYFSGSGGGFVAVTTFSDTSAPCNSTSYYRVIAYDGGSGTQSSPSNVANATTSACVDTTPPSVPTLISPAHGATIYNATPRFDWTDSTGDPVSYELQVMGGPFNVNYIYHIWYSYYDHNWTLEAGQYTWRVRATDAAGNVSAWSTTWSFTLVNVNYLVPGTYQESHPYLTYSGNWINDNNGSANGGSYRYTLDPNAKVSFYFFGNKLTIIRAMAYNRGAMQVCIDGTCQTVDNYSAAVMWQAPTSFNVNNDVHAVEIRNASSAVIDLDALIIEGSTTPPATPTPGTVVPTTPTNTATASNTPTKTATPVNTLTPTNTVTPSNTPTATNTATATNTSAVPVLGAGLHQENNAALTYTGTWTIDPNASASGGSYRFTNGATAKVAFLFAGEKLTIYRAMAFNRGAMQVCIDGNCQTVQNYSANVIWQAPVMFNVAAGTHSVEIRNASTNYIDLDAIRVEGSAAGGPTNTPTNTATPTNTVTPSNTPTATNTATATNTQAAPVLGVGLHQETNAALTYTGTWINDSNASASGGSYRFTNGATAKVAFLFAGEKLTIYRAMAFNRGAMQVCIDGTCYTIQNYSANAIWQVPVVFNVAAGTHSVEIRNASTNYIDLDAIRVEGSAGGGPTNTPTNTATPTKTLTPTQTATNTLSSGGLGLGLHQETNAALTYIGTWINDSNASASGGSYRYTNGATAKVAFQFTGTKLTIYRALAVNRGPMDVCIDGICQTVQNYSANVFWQVGVSFTVTAGTHSVEIRNASSNYIDLDAIRIE